MTDVPQVKPMQLSLAPGVKFSTRLVGDRTSYVAHHADLAKYYRFGAEEHYAASLIDGRRTVADIHALLQSNGVLWSPQEVTDFITKLIQHKIVTVEAPHRDATEESNFARSQPPTQSNLGQPPSPSTMMRITTILSMIVSQRIPLLNGQRVASRFESSLGKLFTPAGAIAWVTLFASALAVVIGHRTEFHQEVQKLFDPAIWPLLIGMWLVAKTGSRDRARCRRSSTRRSNRSNGYHVLPVRTASVCRRHRCLETKRSFASCANCVGRRLC